MEKALEIICDNICTLRKRKKLTQPELATLAKINIKSLRRVEQKTGSPSWATVQLLAAALQVNPFELASPLKEKK